MEQENNTAIEIENGTFAILYIKDKQFYPVAMTSEQHLMAQTFIKSLFSTTGTGKVVLIDKPFGEVENLVQKNTTLPASTKS